MQPEPPRIWETGRGLTVRHRGRLLYSGVDPERGALRRLQASAAGGVPPQTLLFVPSLGLGYGLAELVELAPASSHVLCIETDQQLFAAACGLQPRLFPDHPRLTVVRAGDPATAARLLQGLGAGRFRRLLPIPLSGGYEADRELYDRIADALRDEIRVHWQNRVALIRMGRLWVRNLLANLAALPRARDWTELATGRPVVVAGAGPSLEAGLDWIDRRRDRVFLLAVDTALPVLAGAGLAPDVVFALEAQWVNTRDFLGSKLGQLSVLADLTATPPLLRRAGRLYLCSSRFAPLAVLERLETAGLLPTRIPPLGSVGVAALHVALGLTAGTVFAAGLDFAYSRGRSHARGAPAHLAAMADSCRLQPADSALAAALLERHLTAVPDKNGRPTRSDMVLRGYAAEAARIARSSGRVVDLDPEGLEKGGLEPEAAAAEPGAPAAAGPRRRAAGWSVAALSGFVAAERALAARASARARALLDAGGEPDAGAEELLRSVDYLSFHFPDAPPLAPAGRSFLARLVRSAAETERLWGRAADLLGG